MDPLYRPKPAKEIKKIAHMGRARVQHFPAEKPAGRHVCAPSVKNKNRCACGNSLVSRQWDVVRVNG